MKLQPSGAIFASSVGSSYWRVWPELKGSSEVDDDVDERAPEARIGATEPRWSHEVVGPREPSRADKIKFSLSPIAPSSFCTFSSAPFSSLSMTHYPWDICPAMNMSLCALCVSWSGRQYRGPSKGNTSRWLRRTERTSNAF